MLIKESVGEGFQEEQTRRPTYETHLPVKDLT